jgi:hypothetical protein
MTPPLRGEHDRHVVAGKAIRSPSFVIRHSSFVIRHSSLVTSSAF